MIRPKVFNGRKSINWAKSVLPVFIGDSREDPGSMLRLQIVDTGFCAETRITPGVQSGRLSVNRTAVARTIFLSIPSSVSTCFFQLALGKIAENLRLYR